MYSHIEEKMKKTLGALDNQLAEIRAGRANPNMLDGIMVSYYGALTPLKQLANISVPEARQLSIKPFDKSILGEIEKAIFEANIGLTPNNNGEIWYDLNPMPKCTPTWSLKDGIEYFDSNFLKMLLEGKIDTNDYCELIIFNYMHNISMKIDRKEIIDHLDRNEHCFYFLPMIIYIIGKMYKKYFVSEKEIEV